jgi:hypothetical protein
MAGEKENTKVFVTSGANVIILEFVSRKKWRKNGGRKWREKMAGENSKMAGENGGRKFKNSGRIYHYIGLQSKVASWYIFKPKILIWVNCEGP